MNTKLYVGNLAQDITETDLKNIFSPHGSVCEVRVLSDRGTEGPRAYAFVTMATMEDAATALFALNGRELRGRTLKVNPSHSRTERSETSASGGRRSRYDSWRR